MRSPQETKSSAALAALERCHSTPLELELSRCSREAPIDRALALYHSARSGVPAYARFLAERGAGGSAPASAAEFARLPQTTKDNYHQVGVLRACGAHVAPWPRLRAEVSPATARAPQASDLLIF